MKYDFSKVERDNTDCVKFDFKAERRVPKDALCYWIADMDFKAAPEIIAALHERVEHGVFGYSGIKPHYREAVAAWWKTHYNYEVETPWIVSTPGIVFALSLAVHAMTKPNEPVLIQSPVYYPFTDITYRAGRRIVRNPLIWNWETNRFEIDFEDFENKIAREKIRLFLLCNPHNPGGRSWTKEELERIAEICLKYHVLVVSDEIHSDFVWQPNKHTVFASLSPDIENSTLTCTSASKSFNLAGLQTSNIFIKNERIRRRFRHGLEASGYSEPSALGLVATETAYTKCDDWLTQAKEVLLRNLKKSAEYINTNSSGKITAFLPEATYLLWANCAGLSLSDKELNNQILNDAKLWLDGGSVFGEEGEQFQRINVATSWEYLKTGLERLMSLCK